MIDTLSRTMMGGDENSTKDMAAFVSNLDHLRQASGAHVAVIHHCGHEGSRMRGSNVLAAALDLEVRVTGPGTFGPVSAPRHAVVQTARDQPSGTQLQFCLLPAQHEHDAVQGLVATDTLGEEGLGRTSIPKAAATALNLLQRMTAAPGPARVTLDDWRVACRGVGLSSGNPDSERKAFDRAKTILQEQELIRVEGRQVEVQVHKPVR